MNLSILVRDLSDSEIMRIAPIVRDVLKNQIKGVVKFEMKKESGTVLVVGRDGVPSFVSTPTLSIHGLESLGRLDKQNLELELFSKTGYNTKIIG